jgi:hypothetical protein
VWKDHRASCDLELFIFVWCNHIALYSLLWIPAKNMLE